MYTIMARAKMTLAANYSAWKDAHKLDTELINKTETLLKTAWNEVCREYPEEREQCRTQEDALRLVDHAACLSSKYTSFNTNGPCVYVGGEYDYRMLASTHCFNALLFAFLFRGAPSVLVVPEHFLTLLDWKTELSIIESGEFDLKRVVYAIDRDMDVPFDGGRMTAKFYGLSDHRLYALKETYTDTSEKQDFYTSEIVELPEDSEITCKMKALFENEESRNVPER